jgi:putative tryptophan/tyrosine transport system substrate-binding protein
MLSRRDFLAGTVAALSAPRIAAAQQAGGAPRIGLLFYGSPGSAPELEAFRKGLTDVGYIEAQNIAVEYRFADGRPERLLELATQLVALKPSVIVAPGTPAAVAAKQATGTIPIVFVGVADAIGSGLAARLARPAANVTGLTSNSAQLGGKRLELLKAVVPKASRIAVLYNPGDSSNVLASKDLEQSAPALGLTLQRVEVRTPAEFDSAFTAMTRGHAQALFGAAGLLTTPNRQVLVNLAAKARIPAIWGERQFVESGGLMSYAADFYDQIRRSAIYVDKILKGIPPSDLPIEQPTKLDLVINLKTAKALGLVMPGSLLLQADRVIDS